MGCAQASDCIGGSIDHDGVYRPEWIFAPDSNVECTPDGLYSPKLMHSIACDEEGDFNIGAIPFGGFVSQLGPLVTIANPSPTRAALVMVSVLFGTAQLNVHDEFEAFVLDLVGIAPTGTMVPSSFVVVNSMSVLSDASWGAGGTVAYNNHTSTTWTCPLPLAAGGSLDFQFERRVSGGGAAAGYGNGILRTTFMYAWALAGSAQ